MRQCYWRLIGLLVLIVNGAQSRIIVKRQISSDAFLDPALHEATNEADDRDKRAIGTASATDPKYAIKNALIGFVFNPSKGGSSFSSKTTTTTTKRPTTTEDIVIFEKGKPASLELPSELFGSSFTLVTRASTAIGDYMINSAIRLQRLLEVFRPVIRGVFGVKGFVSEVSTDKPIFSDSSSNE